MHAFKVSAPRISSHRYRDVNVKYVSKFTSSAENECGGLGGFLLD